MAPNALQRSSALRSNEIAKLAAVTVLNRRLNTLYLISFIASQRLQAASFLLRGGRLAKPTNGANIERGPNADSDGSKKFLGTGWFR